MNQGDDECFRSPAKRGNPIMQIGRPNYLPEIPAKCPQVLSPAEPSNDRINGAYPPSPDTITAYRVTSSIHQSSKLLPDVVLYRAAGASWRAAPAAPP